MKLNIVDIITVSNIYFIRMTNETKEAVDINNVNEELVEEPP